MGDLLENVQFDFNESTGLSNDDIIKTMATGVEQQEDGHYVYCLRLNGENSFYVGETSQLSTRISTHLREKDVRELERVELTSDKDEALERERELSYEVAIEKGTTNIYGGR